MSAEKRLEFVDTSVLVYAYDRSAGAKHVRSAELVRSLWVSGQGCHSVQVLQEFYVTVTRKLPKPLDPRKAAELVEGFGHWTVHVPEVRDVLGAVRLHQEARLSFWDALIVWSASELACEVLWSEDLSHGLLIRGVRVVNPFQEDPPVSEARNPAES